MEYHGRTRSVVFYKKLKLEVRNLLKVPCLHTGILSTLSKCGHGDKILIADGNYPLHSNTNDNVERVYLNLTTGLPLVTDVLKVIDQMIAVEKLEVMVPEGGTRPEIFEEFNAIVSSVETLDELGRYEFYEACKAENVKLAIATGEDRIYANVLLTVGVV